MSAEEEGVTLLEVNRNVMELRRQIEGIGTSFLPLIVWNEHQKLIDANHRETGRRIGSIENELAEKRHAFTNSLLYPCVTALVGAGFGALILKLTGG